MGIIVDSILPVTNRETGGIEAVQVVLFLLTSLSHLVQMDQRLHAWKYQG